MGLATGMSSGIILRTPTGNRSPGDMGAYAWWHILGDASLRDDGDESTYTGPIADRGTASGVWRVSQWDDMTGNGRHIVQTTAADQPEVYGSDTGTSGEMIEFLVSRGPLSVSFGATISQPNTVWMVYRQPVNSSGQYMWDSYAGSGPCGLLNNSGTDIALNAGSGVQSVTDHVITSHEALSVVINGASSTGHTNNDGRFTVASTPGSNGLTGFTMGARRDDISNARIHVIDAAVFNRALTNAEELELYAYAQDTHGIA